MRNFQRTLLTTALAAALTPALAAEVLHVAPPNLSAAFQFDWRGTRATIVTSQGRSEASVATSGALRTATLDSPFSTTFLSFDPDCPDAEVEARQDVLQLAVTRLTGTDTRGTSKVVDIGIETTLSGCNAGRVVPFGSPGDEGVPTQHLAATLRPPISDLTPGARLAGPSDRLGLETFPAADVVTFGAGTLSFPATGDAYPLATSNGWLVLSLPFGERAYTRFSVERNGGETWIAADWSGGAPQRVFRTLMVQPAPGAGFGTRRQTSRVWESGLFAGSNNPFYFYLYRDGSGERVQLDLAAGTEGRSPVTWVPDGADVVTRRSFGDGSFGRRTWVPLRNSGTSHFVMESETRTFLDGTVEPFIQPRVNFYIDEGTATPPPSGQARAAQPRTTAPTAGRASPGLLQR